jgi:hypothetical protein
MTRFCGLKPLAADDLTAAREDGRANVGAFSLENEGAADVAMLVIQTMVVCRAWSLRLSRSVWLTSQK